MDGLAHDMRPIGALKVATFTVDDGMKTRRLCGSVPTASVRLRPAPARHLLDALVDILLSEVAGLGPGGFGHRQALGHHRWR